MTTRTKNKSRKSPDPPKPLDAFLGLDFHKTWHALHFSEKVLVLYHTARIMAHRRSPGNCASSPQNRGPGATA